jgi:hypothetical protein
MGQPQSAEGRTAEPVFEGTWDELLTSAYRSTTCTTSVRVITGTLFTPREILRRVAKGP